MSISEKKLKDLVRAGNVTNIRGFLLNIIDANPDMSDGDFKYALSYMEKSIGEASLYVACTDNFEIIRDKRLWDKRYMAKITLALRKEFSKELVAHIQEVGKLAYGGIDTKKKLQVTYGHQNKQGNSKSNKKLMINQVLLMIVIIALVIAVILFLMNYL